MSSFIRAISFWCWKLRWHTHCIVLFFLQTIKIKKTENTLSRRQSVEIHKNHSNRLHTLNKRNHKFSHRNDFTLAEATTLESWSMFLSSAIGGNQQERKTFRIVTLFGLAGRNKNTLTTWWNLMAKATKQLAKMARQHQWPNTRSTISLSRISSFQTRKVSSLTCTGIT